MKKLLIICLFVMGLYVQNHAMQHSKSGNLGGKLVDIETPQVKTLLRDFNKTSNLLEEGASIADNKGKLTDKGKRFVSELKALLNEIVEEVFEN